MLRVIISFYLLVVFSSVVLAQNDIHQNSISGVLYGEQTVVPYVKVYNVSKDKTTFSNVDGEFFILASVKDSIVFTSSFYKKKLVIIDSMQFNNKFVIKLKEQINKIDRVTIIGFEKKEDFNTTLKKELKEDIRKNIVLYQPQSNGAIDIKNIILVVVHLLRKNKNHSNSEKRYISTEDFEILFDDNSVYNDFLLSHELLIPLDFKHLFFEYCESLKINKDYLSSEKSLLLLDSLFKASTEFINIYNLN